MRQVLIVDDELDIVDLLKYAFELKDFKVFQASSYSSAQEILQKEKLDLLVTDFRLPGGTGLHLARDAKKNTSLKPFVILMTGYSEIPKENLLENGIDSIFYKPFVLTELVDQATKLIS